MEEVKTTEIEEVIEPEVEDDKKTKGEKALEEYRKNLTPEQKKANVLKAQETRQKNLQEKREIEVATRVLMSQKFKFRDHTGRLTFGNGFEARANALFKEVVNHGKNMIGAEKQLNLYLGENKEEENTASKQINVVFIQGQEINI
jgi:hypothetical protein